MISIKYVFDATSNKMVEQTEKKNTFLDAKIKEVSTFLGLSAFIVSNLNVLTVEKEFC